MMSTTATILLMTILLLDRPAPTLEDAGRDGCPTPTARATQRVAMLLSLPWIEKSDQPNFGTAGADDIVPLVGASDRDACRALWRAVREQQSGAYSADQAWFYKSGDRYFVPIDTRRPVLPPGAVRIGEFSRILVFDREFRFIVRVDG